MKDPFDTFLQERHPHVDPDTIAATLDDPVDVLVFDPRKGDGPFYLADEWEHIDDGDEPQADQCDGCGGADYVVEGRLVHCRDCGRSYRIFRHPAENTVF